MADRDDKLNWLELLLFMLVSVLLFLMVIGSGHVGLEILVSSGIVVVTALVAIGIACKEINAFNWTTRYMIAFYFAMVSGMTSFSSKLFDVPRTVELPFLFVISMLPLVLAFAKSTSRPQLRWFAFALYLGLLVAMFSGSAGAGDAMIVWLQDKFDWTLEQAQISTRVFRKTVHVTFYALMFLSMARAAWLARGKWFASAMAGLIWATGHAAFDETVQSFFDDRTGSFADYLTDAAGMGIAVVLCWILWGRRGRSPTDGL